MRRDGDCRRQSTAQQAALRGCLPGALCPHCRCRCSGLHPRPGSYSCAWEACHASSLLHRRRNIRTAQSLTASFAIPISNSIPISNRWIHAGDRRTWSRKSNAATSRVLGCTLDKRCPVAHFGLVRVKSGCWHVVKRRHRLRFAILGTSRWQGDNGRPCTAHGSP